MMAAQIWLSLAVSLGLEAEHLIRVRISFEKSQILIGFGTRTLKLNCIFFRVPTFSSAYREAGQTASVTCLPLRWFITQVHSVSKVFPSLKSRFVRRSHLNSYLKKYTHSFLNFKSIV